MEREFVRFLGASHFLILINLGASVESISASSSVPPGLRSHKCFVADLVTLRFPSTEIFADAIAVFAAILLVNRRGALALDSNLLLEVFSLLLSSLVKHHQIN